MFYGQYVMYGPCGTGSEYSDLAPLLVLKIWSARRDHVEPVLRIRIEYLYWFLKLGIQKQRVA